VRFETDCGPTTARLCHLQPLLSLVLQPCSWLGDPGGLSFDCCAVVASPSPPSNELPHHIKRTSPAFVAFLLTHRLATTLSANSPAPNSRAQLLTPLPIHITSHPPVSGHHGCHHQRQPGQPHHIRQCAYEGGAQGGRALHPHQELARGLGRRDHRVDSHSQRTCSPRFPLSRLETQLTPRRSTRPL
jgi:hypothetical protein